MKEKIIALLNNLMLKIDDEELIKLEQDFAVILAQMDLVEKIDTNQVSAMNYPFYSAGNELRNDNMIENLTQEQVLANAPAAAEGYITINQVVK